MEDGGWRMEDGGWRMELYFSCSRGSCCSIGGIQEGVGVGWNWGKQMKEKRPVNSPDASRLAPLGLATSLVLCKDVTIKIGTIIMQKKCNEVD